MKKHITIVIFLALLAPLSSNELEWVDIQIDAIKPPRKGMNNKSIIEIKNPFIFLKKTPLKPSKKTNKKYIKSKKVSSKILTKTSIKPKGSSKKLIIGAIINNSVLINKRWYKTNDKIYDYTILKIGRTSVVLSRDNKKFVLSTDDSKRNIKFK